MAIFLLILSLAFIIGWTSFLLWLFIKTDRGAKEPSRALWAAFGFGVLSVGIALVLEKILLRGPLESDITGGTLFLIAMIVGVVEEAAKFLPLAIFVYKKPYFNEHTDGILYFGLAGLTFGILEDFLYLHRLFTSQETGNMVAGVMRVSVFFLFHVAGTAIIGYYLARSKIQKRSLWQPVVAFSIIAFLHGMYDFLLLYSAYRSRDLVAQEAGAEVSGLGIAIVLFMIIAFIVTLLLGASFFLYYRRAKQWDASVGLAYDPKLQQAQSSSQPTPAQTPPPSAPATYQQPTMPSPNATIPQAPPTTGSTEPLNSNPN